MCDKGDVQEFTTNAAKDALLAEAFLSGRRAGRSGLSSSLTEASPGTPEHAEFFRGWQSGHNEYAQRILGARKEAA